LRAISGFRREVDENCVLLGHYAGDSGNLYRTFGTTYTKVREFNDAVLLYGMILLYMLSSLCEVTGLSIGCEDTDIL